MSEPDNAADQRTMAEVRRSRWPGWIWAVPIAAFGVVGWLGVRAVAHNGDDVVVTFDKAYGLKSGDSTVTLRGVQVGKVSKIALAGDASHVLVHLSLDSTVDKYLHTGTRFWLQGAQVSFSNPSSLRGIIAGPTVIMDPGPGKRADHFAGLASPPQLPRGPQAHYRVRLAGAAGNLDAGAPVMLRGFHVGTVRQVQLVYDTDQDALATTVEIGVQPSTIHVMGADAPHGAATQATANRLLQRMVAHGLRAQLVRDPPMIGQYEIRLDTMSGVAPAQLDLSSAEPLLPSAPSTGLDTVMQKAGAVMDKVDALPLEAVGRHVREAAANVDRLTSSPALTHGIRQLDDALTQIDRTAREARPQVEQVATALRQAADQVDRTAVAARRLAAGDPTHQDSDLPSALHELSQAARSVRELADYLERHPEALVKGKPKGK